MKPGDRVTVIAEQDEYEGLSGQVVRVAENGNLVVDVEVPRRMRAIFKPHDLELAQLAERRER